MSAWSTAVATMHCRDETGGPASAKLILSLESLPGRCPRIPETLPKPIVLPLLQSWSIGSKFRTVPC